MGAIGAAVGLGSALIGSSSASRATKAQTRSADQQVALQSEIYDEQSQLFAPFVGAGTNALAALNFELGLGPRPTVGGTPQQITSEQYTINSPQPESRRYSTSEARIEGRSGNNVFQPQGPTTGTRFRVGDQIFDTMEDAQSYANANTTGGTEYGGFTKTPGYDFRLNEGLSAVDSSVARRQGLVSGNALRARGSYAEDYATGEYNNYLARLSGLASNGQSAAGQQGAAAQSFATGTSNALSARGDAQSAGAIGVGNAFQGGLNNALGIWAYGREAGGL